MSDEPKELEWIVKTLLEINQEIGGSDGGTHLDKFLKRMAWKYHYTTPP